MAEHLTTPAPQPTPRPQAPPVGQYHTTTPGYPALPWPQRLRGMLLGSAVGDALGAGVRHLTWPQIQRHEPTGVRHFLPLFGRPGAVTDNTQLLLFTLEALVRAATTDRPAQPEYPSPTPVLVHSYLRWLHTQGVPWPRIQAAAGGTLPAGWLLGQQELFSTRHVGTQLRSLHGLLTGTPSRGSDGCESLPRVAPVAVFSTSPEHTFGLALETAAMTGDDRAVHLVAGGHTTLLHRLLHGDDVWRACMLVRDEFLARYAEARPAASAMNLALFSTQAGRRPTPDHLERELGDTTEAAGAASLALASVLCTRTFGEALHVATNHSGDSATTGALAGQLAGALYGADEIPGAWLGSVELRETVETMCGDTARVFAPATADSEWARRYPGVRMAAPSDPAATEVTSEFPPITLPPADEVAFGSDDADTTTLPQTRPSATTDTGSALQAPLEPDSAQLGAGLGGTAEVAGTSASGSGSHEDMGPPRASGGRDDAAWSHPDVPAGEGVPMTDTEPEYNAAAADDADPQVDIEPEDPAAPENHSAPEVDLESPAAPEPEDLAEPEVGSESRDVLELDEHRAPAGGVTPTPEPSAEAEVTEPARRHAARAPTTLRTSTEAAAGRAPSPLADRVLGCFLGGALGDALGAGNVEFASIDELRQQYGPRGVTGTHEAYGLRGAITDDTQMTLFTAEGLIRGNIARRTFGVDDPIPDVQLAYQRWIHTQGLAWSQAVGIFRESHPNPDGWLCHVDELHSSRTPSKTVFRALERFGRGLPSGSLAGRINESRSCGGLTRSAPAALWSADPAEAFEIAARTGALTHGHPTGYLPAGTLAALVHQLLRNATLASALEATLPLLGHYDEHEETAAALHRAIDLAAHGVPEPEQLAEHLGDGHTADQALAIAVCATLVAAEEPADALRIAVNHSGPSDATGTVCGHLVGALHGSEGLPADWLAELELRDVVEQIAQDCVLEFTADSSTTPPTGQAWHERYPVPSPGFPAVPPQQGSTPTATTLETSSAGLIGSGTVQAEGLEFPIEENNAQRPGLSEEPERADEFSDETASAPLLPDTAPEELSWPDPTSEPSQDHATDPTDGDAPHGSAVDTARHPQYRGEDLGERELPRQPVAEDATDPMDLTGRGRSVGEDQVTDLAGQSRQQARHAEHDYFDSDTVPPKPAPRRMNGSPINPHSPQ